MSVIDLSDKDFDGEVLDSKVPVVVDFYTKTCGPCRNLLPVFTKAAESNPNLKFVKVDVAENLDLADRLGVRGVPTILAFSEGKEVGRQVGFTGEPVLLKFLSVLDKK